MQFLHVVDYVAQVHVGVALNFEAPDRSLVVASDIPEVVVPSVVLVGFVAEAVILTSAVQDVLPPEDWSARLKDTNTLSVGFNLQLV